MKVVAGHLQAASPGDLRRAELRRIPSFVRALSPVIRGMDVHIYRPIGDWTRPEGSVIHTLPHSNRNSAVMIEDRLWPKVSKKALEHVFFFENGICNVLYRDFDSFASYFEADWIGPGLPSMVEAELNRGAVNVLAQYLRYPMSVQAIFSDIGNKFIYVDTSVSNNIGEAVLNAKMICREMLFGEVRSNITLKLPGVLTAILDGEVHGYRYHII